MNIRVFACVLSVLVLGFISSCSKPEKEPEAPPPTKETYKAPDMPEELKKAQESTTSKDLITEEAVERRRRIVPYLHDPQLGGGTLRGVCYVPFEKPIRLYPPMPMELTGDNAVQKPKDGEAAYFETRRPATRVWLGNHHGGFKRYGVFGAVVMFKDLKVGKLAMLERASFKIDETQNQIVSTGPGWGPIGCAPSGLRVQMVHTDIYDCVLAVNHLERKLTLFEETIPGYNDPKFPGERYGSNFQMKMPENRQIRTLDEQGIYGIQCKRHPWHRAYMFVVQNPYVAVTVPHHDWNPALSGQFSMADVPPGHHTIEVWHPEYEPTQKTYEVDIEPDKATELEIKFKVPPILEAPAPALPEKPIMEWAFVGPFELLTVNTVLPPEQKLDFKASYTGKNEEKIRWRGVKTTEKNGCVRLNPLVGDDGEQSVNFFAVKLDSPKEQKVLIGEGSANFMKMWLNGKMVYDGNRHNNVNPNTNLTYLDLKAGENMLLIKQYTNQWVGRKEDGIVITYQGDDIKSSSPVAPK